MPELIEQMYCSQQIVIPPKYPYILKRYCKAAIKTQPYDLLRWSFEYFKALSEHRPPPVKLRLEYPVYSTEGGLTRGCLKVLAQQLSGMTDIPMDVVKQAWQGFCLDPTELKRILCLCEVYLRAESVPYLHFLAVAGGMLTKCLTHTMILLCESLTKEPDGGSAAVPAKDFLVMYKFLANIDASKDIKYHNGYKEGQLPPEESVEEETAQVSETKIEPQTMIDSESLLAKRRAAPCDEVDRKLRELSTARLTSELEIPKEVKSTEEEKVEKKEKVDIFVFDEEDQAVKYEIYGEKPEVEEDESKTEVKPEPKAGEEAVQEEEQLTDSEKVALFMSKVWQEKEERLVDLEQTFDDIAAIVDKYKTANYDLGMVAGRQMSTTSGEFIVQHIEREILAYIDDQIAILPDPDLKKKKAKPEEVAMIRDILEQFLDDNMEVIVPEVEEVEEEEAPLPEIVTVYAVPGIGPVVDVDIATDFEEYAREVSKIQADMVMPRNLRHFLCPPLEKYK